MKLREVGQWTQDTQTLLSGAPFCAQPCPHTAGLPHPQLLGLSMAAMAAVNYLGTHFAVVGRASSDRTPYEATRRWASCTSISLAGLLTLGAVLGAVATVREAGGLMAGGFLCFALAFCILVQVAFWRFHNPAQVEDAVLDTYDLVYDQAVRSSSVTLRQQLVAIQDTFLCCGKNSPFGLLGGTEVSLCPGEEATRQDCLVAVRSFLRTYGNIASTLTGIGLASTAYAVLLSSFLWFAFRSGCSLDRRGKYTLSRRARDCRPQEPSFFRRSPGGPALQHPMEADVLDGRLRASRPSGGPQFLQDS
ncbi:tetraspanin-32 isoform X1 [Prionailurus viverrinus]|uniref:tetraspanin-32 isoform X1 n=1 Tax=Prionailurus viverrinus TaxID=61388 RepID=UPI001FF40022|nr:tetraspanin-32 isoform X1 [Prionailurus viverrinus]